MWQKCICNNIGDLGIIIPMLYSLCYTDYQLFKLYCTIITQSIGIRALSTKMVPKCWMPIPIQPGRSIMSFIMVLCADTDEDFNPIQLGWSIRSWVVDIFIKIELHNNNTTHRHSSSEYLHMKIVPKHWMLMPTPIQPGRSIMSFIMVPNVRCWWRS